MPEAQDTEEEALNENQEENSIPEESGEINDPVYGAQDNEEEALNENRVENAVQSIASGAEQWKTKSILSTVLILLIAIQSLI